MTIRSMALATALLAGVTASVPAGEFPSFNVSLRARLSLEGPCQDVDARGDLAIVTRDDQIYLIDVSDPDAPVLASTWQHPTEIMSSWDARILRDGVAVVANEIGTDVGLFVLDVSDPTNPVLIRDLSEPEFPGSVHNVWPDPDGRHLYAAGRISSSNHGTYILDLDDLDAPAVLSRVQAEWHDMFPADGRLYIAGSFETYLIADITDRSAPVELSRFDPNTPDTLYIMHSLIPVPGSDIVISTEELQISSDGTSTQGSMRGWDVSDPDHVVPVWRWKSDNMATHPFTTVHNPYVVGDVLTLSCYQDGLRVFDIQDPRDPVEVAYFDTWEGADEPFFFFGNWGVDPYEGLDEIYLSDSINGLFVVAFNGARRTRLEGRVLDADTGDPVLGAQVVSLTADRATPSDLTGAYRLDTGSGTHAIRVAASGYEVLEDELVLDPDGTLVRDFQLVPSTVDVNPVHVASPTFVRAVPNPVRESTTIEVDLDPRHAESIRIDLFAPDGRMVRRLALTPARQGTSTARWDRRDHAGRPVAPGVYLARVRTGTIERSIPLVVLR